MIRITHPNVYFFGGAGFEVDGSFPERRINSIVIRPQVGDILSRLTITKFPLLRSYQ